MKGKIGKDMIQKDRRKIWIVGAAITLLIFMLVIGCMVFILSGKKSNSTVLVQTPFYTGQGNVYKCDGNETYIVTAAHILEGLHEYDTCDVYISKEYQMQAEIRYISETADVAFLVFNLQQNVNHSTDSVQLKAVKTNRSHFDDLKEGSPVYAYSYDGMDRTKITGSLVSSWIYLEDFNLNMMLAQLPSKQGMSGCGVYDEKGFFVGIICGSNEEETAILPFSVIESEWIMYKD